MNTPRSLIAMTVFAISTTSHAGLFLFAENQENPNIITHPIGYTGDNNQHLEISVCIHPDSESIGELEIPLRNALTVWNRLEPTQGNVIRPNSELDFSAFDVESVLLHEVGHCIGLAHPNLASESGLSGDDTHFSKTLEGPNNQYDLDAGTDSVIGTRDDQRGDDINLNWFHAATNDPFAWPTVIDASTYSVDLSDLPSNHQFVEISGWEVWQQRGLSHTIAVMFQGITNSETRRELNHDDAAMIRLAMAGTDRTQDTNSDYTFELQYGGVSDGCDITVSMEGGSFGFCQVSATKTGLPANHWRIDSANIQVASTNEINWHFNSELLSDDMIFQDRFEE